MHEQRSVESIRYADYDRIKAECQRVAEETYAKLHSGIPNSELNADSRLPSACGFGWVKFKGVKNKNYLEKAGFKIDKDYPSGYSISLYPLYDEPEWVKAIPDAPSGYNNARAVFQQSVEIEEAVAQKLAEMLKDEFGVECWADSRLD